MRNACTRIVVIVFLLACLYQAVANVPTNPRATKPRQRNRDKGRNQTAEGREANGEGRIRKGKGGRRLPEG